MEAGLREKKKQRTREAIVDAALELFEKQGFEKTTIADIAAAADIAPRTFFGYFSSKEGVLFEHEDSDFQSFHDAVDSRPEGVTTMEAMRAWIAELMDERGHDDARDLRRRQCIDQSENLTAYQRALMGRFGDIIAVGVARDLGIEPDSPRARMAGSAAVATFEALSAAMKGDDEKPEDPMAVVDEALAFIAGGIAALQDRAR
jgi:AcrR family transcriptional regulator